MTAEETRAKSIKDKEEAKNKIQEEHFKVAIEHIDLFKTTLTKVVEFLNEQKDILNTKNMSPLAYQNMLQYCTHIKASLKLYQKAILDNPSNSVLNPHYLNIRTLFENIWMAGTSIKYGNYFITTKSLFNKVNKEYGTEFINSTIGSLKSINNRGYTIYLYPDSKKEIIGKSLYKNISKQ